MSFKTSLSRAKYAAIGAAVGAALGGLLSRNAASTGGAVGGLVGASLAEFHLSDVVSQAKQKVRVADS
ncbi:glycine zipper domain-containing protein [Halalkalirubrum salinum]|uniref:glycine zipper domain-containing protein n=1 Tax=Halalkalirubrum salinum TaxID=2563889 RepID=UPI0010FB499F|nr:glycine zipper domain-containing protein [Halalkalirubrum salinum]